MTTPEQWGNRIAVVMALTIFLCAIEVVLLIVYAVTR